MLPQKFRPEWTGVVRHLTATAEQTDMLYGGCSRFSAFNMGPSIPANRSSRLFFTQPLTGILRSNRSVSNTGVFIFVSPSAYSSKSRFIERSPRTHFYTGVIYRTISGQSAAVCGTAFSTALQLSQINPGFFGSHPTSVPVSILLP